MSDTALLYAENLSKTFLKGNSSIQALGRFNFTVNSGELIGLLGPNGAGKTTLVKALTTLTTVDSGEMFWKSQPIANRQYLKNVGVLLEGRGVINDRLSPYENARYACGLKQAPFNKSYFEWLCSKLGVAKPYSPMRTLSTGNKLRCSLLCSLIHKPELIFLDEPTNGLDSEGVDKLERLIRELSSGGAAFVVASHDLDFIQRLCKRVVCISAGIKVYDGQQNDFRTLDHGVRVSISPGAEGLPALPQPWTWQIHPDQSGDIYVRDHAELCTLLPLLTPYFSDAQGLSIQSMTLRDKYHSLLNATKKI